MKMITEKEELIQQLERKENIKKLYDHFYMGKFDRYRIKGSQVGNYGLPNYKQIFKMANEINLQPTVKRSRFFDLKISIPNLLVYDGESIKLLEHAYKSYPDGVVMIGSFTCNFQPNARGVITLNIDVIPKFDLNSFNLLLKKRTASLLSDSFNYVIYSPDTRFESELERHGIRFLTPNALGLE